MVEINRLTPEKIDEKFFKKTAEAVLKGENKKGELSVVFVCQRRIQGLNKKYRKKDKPTDVLSFKYNEDKNTLGEIVICPEIVKKNAKKFDLDYNKELTKVLIHGILHILGYDHENLEKEAREMEKVENKYLKKLF